MGQRIVTNQKEPRTMTGRAVSRLVRSRRRVGTVAAFVIALLLGYHVVVGDNGLDVYKQKLAEDKKLTADLNLQKQINDRLKQHVDHLASDPDAIAYEVHQRLRYAGIREVIVLKDDITSDPAGTPSK